MKRSLFTELENYTDKALKLSMDIQEVLTPFYENASKEGLPLREIELIILNAVVISKYLYEQKKDE